MTSGIIAFEYTRKDSYCAAGACRYCSVIFLRVDFREANDAIQAVQVDAAEHYKERHAIRQENLANLRPLCMACAGNGSGYAFQVIPKLAPGESVPLDGRFVRCEKCSGTGVGKRNWRYWLWRVRRAVSV